MMKQVLSFPNIRVNAMALAIVIFAILESLNFGYMNTSLLLVGIFILSFRQFSLLPLITFALAPYLIISFSKILHFSIWPLLHLFLPLLLCLFVSRSSLKSCIRIRIEKPSKQLLLFIIFIIVSASIALFIWKSFYPAYSSFFNNLLSNFSYKMLLLILGFSILNASLEEIIFRGIIQDTLLECFSSWQGFGKYLAIIMQGIWFGAIHFKIGFPCYFSGFLLASIYGIILGQLKAETQNLFFSIIAHIFADITIMLLLIFY